MEPSSQIGVVIEPRKWKRGEVGPDGRVFWEKNKAFPSGQYWVAAEDFPRMVEAKRASKKAFYERHKAKILAYSKVRHARVGASAEHKARRKKYRDANAPALRKNEAAWRKKTFQERPELRVLGTMRSRMKIAVRTAIKQAAQGRINVPTRAQDKESVRFLVWLAAKQGVDPMNGRAWHIDHIVPVSKCADLTTANRPENVRWLKSEVNMGRGDADATQEEVEAHLVLVKEWRNEILDTDEKSA